MVAKVAGVVLCHGSGGGERRASRTEPWGIVSFMSYGEEKLAIVVTHETTIIHNKDLISFVHQQYSFIHSTGIY